MDVLSDQLFFFLVVILNNKIKNMHAKTNYLIQIEEERDI